MAEECAFAKRDRRCEISAFGAERESGGYEQGSHQHHDHELVLVIRGLITFEVENGRWIVPPGCALWIPKGVTHSVRICGGMELYGLFISSAVRRKFPSRCCTMTASPLMRELAIAAAQLPRRYSSKGSEARLVSVLLDEVSATPIEELYLPLPTDVRLRKIADTLARSPEDRSTAAEWAQRIAMSERTLFRLVSEQTGMSFGRWRQQFQIMLALEKLSRGESVQSVSMDLGYESASAFIAMFKKALGKPPAKYLAEKNNLSNANIIISPRPYAEESVYYS